MFWAKPVINKKNNQITINLPRRKFKKELLNQKPVLVHIKEIEFYFDKNKGAKK